MPESFSVFNFLYKICYYVSSSNFSITKYVLKSDFVFHKISEMIEIESREILEEEEVQQNVRHDSQMAFWIAFLQRYSATNQISSFKFFIYMILVIPSNTAGLERMFKKLKQLKSKVRNRLGEKKTKQLMMIMNFIDDINWDLRKIVEKFRDLMKWSDHNSEKYICCQYKNKYYTLHIMVFFLKIDKATSGTKRRDIVVYFIQKVKKH